MDEKHNVEEEETEAEEQQSATPSRARNRTVLLTPEITGQVRSMLGGNAEPAPRERSGRDPLADLLPPLSGGSEPRPSDVFNADSEATAPDAVSGLIPGSVPEDRDPTGKMRLENETRAHNVQPQPAAGPSFSVNAASASTQQGVTPQRNPSSKIIGFLISFDTNEYGDVYEVRAGRWLLTSRPTDHGDFILIDDKTISPLHAIIRGGRDGKIQILDQLSEFGTGVTTGDDDEEQEVTGSMIAVDHGDLVRFGERRFVVVKVPEVSLPDGDSSEDDSAD